MHYTSTSGDGHKRGQTLHRVSQAYDQYGHGGFFRGDCIGCHSMRQGNRAPVSGQFSANSHHIQGAALTNQQCYQCHWEANSDGSVNNTYHGGSANPGSVVNLVVYGTGTRPSGYTVGTTAIEYSANGSRTEMQKLNQHCLGCHDNDSAAAQPFGDGKTPKQYAWDGTTVAARYSQTGTTTWGKYTGTTNASKKNIAKAFSSHGNAAANGRGWSTTTGVDGTISNTSGSINVLCFDCHNSHGSNANGTTTNYTSATTNGGILKDTTDGIGGYSMSYKPASGGTTTTHNAYASGAALCFDPDRPDYVAVMYGPQLLVACTSGGAQYNGSESQLLSSLTPVSGQACTFTAALTTGNVTFKPLNRVITETYNGYTIITNPIAATVKDYVAIADQTSETAHSLQSSSSSTGSYNGKNWRDATNGGWFSYKMAVDSGKTMYVRCTYWGSDATNRVFYLQIDGNNIATQRLENNNPNNFFQLIYPVPAALTNGKSSVTVRFQAKSGNTAGGVFDRVEMLTYDAVVSTPTPTPTRGPRRLLPQPRRRPRPLVRARPFPRSKRRVTTASRESRLKAAAKAGRISGISRMGIMWFTTVSISAAAPQDFRLE